MTINTDINILGGLPDFNLVLHFLENPEPSGNKDHQTFSTIKTTKAVKRFRHTILKSLLSFPNPDAEILVKTSLWGEGISKDTLMLLFWVFSFNNELMHHLNRSVLFPALFSGRTGISYEEVKACLWELRQTEADLKKWSAETLSTTASKYLTILVKFGILEGSAHKSIPTIYLSDKLLALFVYWLSAIELRTNIIDSQWLNYSFCEQPVLIERILQKKLSPFLSVFYTGNNLKTDTLISYENIYHAVSKS